MKYIAAVIALLMLSGCASQRTAEDKTSSSSQASRPRSPTASGGIVYEGGDGSSIEKAVIIKAPNNAAGVRAESNCIRKNHPGWRKGNQALVSGDNGKMYDRIDYTTPTGETKTLYFDITDFFGKW